MANSKLNLGEGNSWAYSQGVNKHFENLVCFMGNVTLAEFVELTQTIETVLPKGNTLKNFRKRFEVFKLLPQKIIRRVLLHPVWIYWVRSTRQIIYAKIRSEQISPQWCQHLNPKKTTNLGYLSESLELFSELLLVAYILAGKEIEIQMSISGRNFLSLAGSGLAIDCADLFSHSDKINETTSILVKEIGQGNFGLIFKNSTKELARVDYQLKNQANGMAFASSIFPNHRLVQLKIDDHFCEINNRDYRIIKNWVWFDIYPGKPTVKVAKDTQIKSWHDKLSAGFQDLQKFSPLLAKELSFIWRCVTPVSTNQSEQSVSCSSRDFWGAIQLSSHPGIALPEVLVHEYRHNILNAILEFDSLISEDSSKESVFYSPWRIDSRPLLGLLHGIYSFVEVVDFNLNYLEKSNGRDDFQTEFAEQRAISNLCRLKIAINELESYAKFTSFGQDLFQGIVKRFGHFENNTIDLNPAFWRVQTQQVENQYLKWLKTNRK